MGLVVFTCSKLVSAVRLNINFKNIGIQLPEWQNIRLYWLGMFYNLFLPGSVGGDAYKVILLQKKYNSGYQKITAAVLLDRISGLLGLGLLLSLYAFFVLPGILNPVLVTGLAFLAILAFYFLLKKWLMYFLSGFTPTLLLGLVVQVLQVVCIYFIMAALKIPGQLSGYVFVFLCSSALSVLPLTIGGLGIREIVFLEGSQYLGLLPDAAVLISLLFYLITLISSGAGMYFVFKNPLAEKKRGPLLSP